MMAAMIALLLAATPVLSLPIACDAAACVIQSYPDDDPGPGVSDYQCHGRSYQAHDGTDFRIPSMARQRAGVAVLAAAGGMVRRVRDGVADVSVRERPMADGQDCGNGIVIDHGSGWETQYCHLARGSVTVRPGQAVAGGAAIARVGLSGNTEFPHVHLTVREKGRAVDPFAYGAVPGQCGGGRSLWKQTPAYERGSVLVAGFSAGPVTMAMVQETGAAQSRPGRATPLVAFAQAIGLAAGDVQRLVLTGPDGAKLAENAAAPLDRDKAQTVLFAGRRPPAGGWTAGRYRARYTVTRGGRTVVARDYGLSL